MLEAAHMDMPAMLAGVVGEEVGVLHENFCDCMMQYKTGLNSTKGMLYMSILTPLLGH